MLTPKIGDKILRDPCILYGPDKIFHLVYTTSWKSKEIGYAFSKDLVHWSEEVLIPVMHHEPETENSWAPEVVWDEEKKHYFIFWSSRIKGYHLLKINFDNSPKEIAKFFCLQIQIIKNKS